MPLVGIYHSAFWQDQGEPPPTPGLRKLLLLNVGHGVFLFISIVLMMRVGWV